MAVVVSNESLKTFFNQIYERKEQIKSLFYPIFEKLAVEGGWVSRRDIQEHISEKYEQRDNWGRGDGISLDHYWSKRFGYSEDKEIFNELFEHDGNKPGDKKQKYRLKNKHLQTVRAFLQDYPVPDVIGLIESNKSEQKKTAVAARRPKFWKISHGKNSGDLKNSAHNWLMENDFVAQGYSEDSKEGKNQGRYFHEIAQGDYFYLVRESAVVLLGRFGPGPVVPVPDDLENIKGWLMRDVEPITNISDRRFMSVKMPGKEIWKPQGFSTVAQITEKNLPELERKLLVPAFGTTLAELGIDIDPDVAAGDAEEQADASPLNQILYGPPGTGKTYHTVRAALCILENTQDPAGEYADWKVRYDALRAEGRIEFVTFHQSFSYEDFVEGLRADAQLGSLSYRIKDGIFKQIATRAMFSRLSPDDLAVDYEAMRERVLQADADFSSPGVPHVLIIDEINRGNTSRIFGELITLIESSKRYGRAEQIELRLPYSNEIFRVPDNLYVIGTMNTAGRSLALMDTALRRRFDFIEKMPDLEELEDKSVKSVNLVRMLAAINDRIEALYDREHTIGHAFFMELHDQSTIADLARIFRNKILPLLEEYFFEDWEKISLVLGKSGIYTLKDFDNLGFERKGKTFQRNLKVLDFEETYIRIYDLGDRADIDE